MHVSLKCGAISIAISFFIIVQVVAKEVKPIKSVPSAGKVIALTFDDGIETAIHSGMLDILIKESVPVTFFLIGNKTSNERVIKRAIKEGHEIGNHSMTHPKLPTLTTSEIFQEIVGFQQTLKTKFNYQVNVFRAPKLQYDARVMAILKAQNLIAVNATTGTKDYAEETTRDYILQTATRSPKLTDGSIILMHEVQKTLDVLPEIIKFYKQRGYRFVTVSQLLALSK